MSTAQFRLVRLTSSVSDRFGAVHHLSDRRSGIDR